MESYTKEREVQQEQILHPCCVALVVGVTGMAGSALAEALKQPTALGGPWKVFGAARRPKPSGFPSSIIDHYMAFDAADFDDSNNKLSSIAHEITHVFWVAIQVRESEVADVQFNEVMLANVLHVLKSAQGSRLTHITLQTGTKHYMGPIYDPAHSHQLIPHDPPFNDDLLRLPSPNFYYELEDLVASHAPSISYSIHRSSIIIGASTRSDKYTWDNLCEMTEARVLPEQHVWAAVTDKSKNQALNCTNGDIFSWKRMWKVLGEVFDVEFVAFDENEEFDFVRIMKERGKIWDEIVKKYGLYDTKIDEITCFEALNHVLHFGFQHVSSMNKSREFGFFGYVDTLKSIGMWVDKIEKYENCTLTL